MVLLLYICMPVLVGAELAHVLVYTVSQEVDRITPPGTTFRLGFLQQVRTTVSRYHTG